MKRIRISGVTDDFIPAHFFPKGKNRLVHSFSRGRNGLAHSFFRGRNWQGEDMAYYTPVTYGLKTLWQRSFVFHEQILTLFLCIKLSTSSVRIYLWLLLHFELCKTEMLHQAKGGKEHLDFNNRTHFLIVQRYNITVFHGPWCHASIVHPDHLAHKHH